MEDNIVKFLAYNGRIAITCAETTMLVEKARNTHDLSPVATAALGRLLTMGVIMGSDLKSEKDNITLQIKGDGPIGRMVAVVNKNLQIKGMVENPQVDAPLNEFGKLDVGGVVGYNGYVNVIKDIGLKEPYIGVIPISSGEIAEDFARYFTESEQTRSAVALGVLVDKNGVKKAGGYLLTAMPDATDEDITKIEKSIFEAGAISKMLDDNLSLLEIAKKVTGDKNVKVIQTDMHQMYISKIQAQDVKYSTYSFFNAISSGNVQLVDLFLKSGMSPDATFMSTPAIYMAIASNQNEVVKLLLENKVDPNKEIAGLTPLIIAIKKKDAQIVETLIAYGADVNKQASYINPLSYAIKKKQPKIVEVLVKAGARPDNEVLINALKCNDSYIKETVLKRYKEMD